MSDISLTKSFEKEAKRSLGSRIMDYLKATIDYYGEIASKSGNHFSMLF